MLKISLNKGVEGGGVNESSENQVHTTDYYKYIRQAVAALSMYNGLFINYDLRKEL